MEDTEKAFSSGMRIHRKQANPRAAHERDTSRRQAATPAEVQPVDDLNAKFALRDALCVNGDQEPRLFGGETALSWPRGGELPFVVSGGEVAFPG